MAPRLATPHVKIESYLSKAWNHDSSQRDKARNGNSCRVEVQLEGSSRHVGDASVSSNEHMGFLASTRTILVHACECKDSTGTMDLLFLEVCPFLVDRKCSNCLPITFEGTRVSHPSSYIRFTHMYPSMWLVMVFKGTFYVSTPFGFVCRGQELRWFIAPPSGRPRDPKITIKEEPICVLSIRTLTHGSPIRWRRHEACISRISFEIAMKNGWFRMILTYVVNPFPHLPRLRLGHPTFHLLVASFVVLFPLLFRTTLASFSIFRLNSRGNSDEV
eukprot:scaffold2274_cov343-Pavlova_lutheri.AAC.5